MATQPIPRATPIAFRQIEPDDVERLVSVFDRLSPRSRYFRFLAHIRSVPDSELERLTHVDFLDHVAWVAELSGEPGRPLAGVARWVRSPHDPALAEIAITVVDDYHRQGIGTELLKLLAQSAARRGVRSFEANVLSENQPMRSLLRGFGARQVGVEAGTYVLRLSVATILQEHLVAS